MQLLLVAYFIKVSIIYSIKQNMKPAVVHQVKTVQNQKLMKMYVSYIASYTPIYLVLPELAAFI